MDFVLILCLCMRACIRSHISELYGPILFTILLGRTGATHRHLHKAQRKRKSRLPWFASSTWRPPLESLWRGAPTSSCRASLAPCARQFGRGFWGSCSSCAAISVRTGSGAAGAPLRVTLGKTLSFFNHYRPTRAQRQS